MLALLVPPLVVLPRDPPRPKPWWITRAFTLVSCVAIPMGVLNGDRYRADVPSVAGDLRIVGSRTMAGPVGDWVTIFKREHPRVAVKIALEGSGSAAGAMVDGIADVAPLTRALAPAERALFAGALPHRIVIGRGRLRAQRAATPVFLYLARPAGAPPGVAAREFAAVALSHEGAAAAADN